MSPGEAEEVLAHRLGLAGLQAGDQGYSLPLEDGLVVEVHANAGRDWLLLRSRVGEYSPGGAHASRVAALAGNLATARCGVPALVFEPMDHQVLARSVLWLPPLGAGELTDALASFGAYCAELRVQLEVATAAV